jgi:hypothetical protein
MDLTIMDPVTFLENLEVIAETAGGVERLRKSIVQLALHGKLVEQNTSETPARQLLIQIEHERQTGLLHDQVTVSVTRPDWPVWS